ncbi:MAG: DUF3108 domain-containing protein [Bacteroidales bacterium]|nr:DUF3108 domain-containing protein [Bacteroidales bacterium]
MIDGIRRFNILFAVFLCSLNGFAQNIVSPEALGAVRYDIRYKLGILNTAVADATITLEEGEWQGRPALHSSAVIEAKSVFKLFMNASYIVDLYLTPEKAEPLYYINPFKKGGKDGMVEFTYDRGGGKINFVAVRPPADTATGSFPLDGRTMDLLSTLQYVRFAGLAEGKPLSLNLLKGGKAIPTTVDFFGRDTERFPGREAERLQLTMHGDGLMENGSGNVLVIWRSPGHDRRILGLEASLGSGTMTVSLRE